RIFDQRRDQQRLIHHQAAHDDLLGCGVSWRRLAPCVRIWRRRWSCMANPLHLQPKLPGKRLRLAGARAAEPPVPGGRHAFPVLDLSLGAKRTVLAALETRTPVLIFVWIWSRYGTNPDHEPLAEAAQRANGPQKQSRAYVKLRCGCLQLAHPIPAEPVSS